MEGPGSLALHESWTLMSISSGTAQATTPLEVIHILDQKPMPLSPGITVEESAAGLSTLTPLFPTSHLNAAV